MDRFERSLDPDWVHERSRSDFTVCDDKFVVPERPADLDVLSASEIECLDWAIQEYGNLGFDALTQKSQDQAWMSAEENEVIALEKIVATLPNAEELQEHLRDPYPG